MSILNDFAGQTTKDLEDSKSDFKLAPSNWYKLICTDAVEKHAEKGPRVDLTFEIAEGEYQGTRVYHSLYLGYENEVTVSIAKAALARISEEMGMKGNPSKLHQFHDQIMIAPILLTPPRPKKDGDGDWPEKNEINHKWLYKNGAAKITNPNRGQTMAAPSLGASNFASPPPYEEKKEEADDIPF